MILKSCKIVSSVSIPLLHFCAKNILVSQSASRDINGNRDYFMSGDNLQAVVHAGIFTESQGITLLSKIYLRK